MSDQRLAPGQDGLAQARLAAIVDSSFDAIISKNLDSIITSWNAAAERLFGYTAEEAIGQSILMLIPEHLHGEESDIISRVRRGERVPTMETMRLRKGGIPVTVSITVSPIRDETGTIVGASKIARDISAAKESDMRIRMLMREVNHRVKNQFAIILALIRESVNRSPDPQQLSHRIQDRIMALSRSQDLLVDSQWAGADLADLFATHVRPFAGRDAVPMDGPAIWLRPNAVQHLGMAAHELAANAATAGALAEQRGSVSIAWYVVGEDLVLQWQETIAHRAQMKAPQPHRGFGTLVLTRIAPQSLGGTASLDILPDGMKWSLRAPLSAIRGLDTE
jgi:PAS domain S-box-containing protein